MFILFFFFLSNVLSQLSVPPTWIPNPYLETRLYQIKSDFTTTTQSGAANITFAQVYSQPPQVAFGITTYSGNDGLYQQNFYMTTLRVTTSQVEIKMVIIGITNIRLFYVMYVAIHPDFLYHLNAFNDIEANYTTTGSMTLAPIDTITTSTRVFTNYINYNQLCINGNTKHKLFGNNLSKNKIAVYLSGVYNQATSGIMTEVKFDILADPVNSTHFKLTVTVNPNYRIWLLRLSFIGMDIENIESSKEYTLVYNTDRYYFDQDYYIPLQQEFFGNIFMGMLDFNTQAPACTIDFNLIFDQPNSRIIVKKSVPNPGSLYPTCGLKSARMNTFYMKTWLCPPPNYFFNLDTDMCDDYCPTYSWGDKIAKKCITCPLGCADCTPSNYLNYTNPDNCTKCDSVKDFRELRNGQCQCMDGYYLQNPTDLACTPCISTDTSCNKSKGKIQSDDTLAKAILYGSYGILALSAIPCKIIGLQLFGVLQLAYFSLAEISSLNAILTPFIKFGAANGFNPDMASSNQILPKKISVIEYDGVFLNNCGLMLILLVVQGLIGLILYLISVFIKPSLFLSSLSKRLLKEGFLTLILFNSFNLAFGTGIHFKYADSNLEGYSLNSFLCVLSMIIPIIMIFGIIFAESKDFGEFKDKFKKQPVSQLYFVVTILYRYFLGYFMAVKSENELGSLVVIMFSLLFILYNFVNLPFKSAMHNYRANVCHLSQLGILVVANYYESMKATTDEEIKLRLFTGAYLQISMILLSMVVSVIVLGFDIYDFVRSIIRNKSKINPQMSHLNKQVDMNDTEPNIGQKIGNKELGQFIQQDSLVNLQQAMKSQQNSILIEDITSQQQ